MPLTSHTIYFENAAGRLSEHANNYALLQYKPGKRALADFQALLTHLGHLLQRRRWNKVLTDQRAMTPFTDEERAWISARWVRDPTEPLQETMIALLLPHDVFARLSTNQILHDARQGSVVYHVFENEVAAGTWLRQVP